MATIMNDAAYMGFPLSIKRGNPAPVDTTAVWYNKTELETYAASGATAYVGQILTLYTDGKAEAYMIADEAGTLVKLAQTTASGDLASDVAALQGQVNSLIAKVGVAAEGETAATGLYALIDEVKALANSKVTSISATDASVVVDSSTATAPKIQVQISKAEKNALTLADDGLKVIVPDVTHPEYTVKKLETATAGMSASYQLTKDGTGVGAIIDIPKDMVVESGTVVTNPEGQPAGTYLVLTLANKTSDKVYINVGNLIEYVTAGDSPDGMVVVSISNDHKVTATLGDASITEAKLAKEVTDKLAKAVSAVQSVTAGSTNGTIAVNGEDVAVTGLEDAAFATVASLNKTAQDKVDAAKTALEGTDSDDKTAVTIKGAKAFATDAAATAKNEAIADAKGKIDALKVEDTAVAKQFVSAVSEAGGKITVERRELVAEDVPELGISKISGLQGALDAKQDTVTFNTAYDAATNKAATMSDVNTAKSTLVGKAEDLSSVDTIKGAKKYAEEKAGEALTSAKSYADGLVGTESAIAGRVAALEGKHAEGKTVAQEVSDGISALKLADTYAAKKATEDHIANTDIHVTAAKKTAWDDAVSNVETLMGTEATTGSVKQIAKSYADGKDTAIAAAKSAGDNAQTAVDALGTKVGTIPTTSKATSVVGYVDEQVKAVKDAEVDYTVTVTPSDVTGVAKRYTIAQASTGLNVNIDIPKDMVVSSGTVETNPDETHTGTFLVLTLANATNDKVYINVSDLIEYVTSGSKVGDMVVVDVSADHKVTATITDGTITKAKLATTVQTSLDLADTALQTAALEPYAKTADVAKGYVAKNGTDRLMTADEGTKLAGIAEGAQANVIESISGVTTTVENKDVKITGVSTDLLTQGTDTLILDCGGVE
nr:MAG TPA: hypothetical protein [Caudoviricetes sp.]